MCLKFIISLKILFDQQSNMQKIIDFVDKSYFTQNIINLKETLKQLKIINLIESRTCIRKSPIDKKLVHFAENHKFLRTS